MRRRYVMGTFLGVSVIGGRAPDLADIFLDEVQRLEGLLSIYLPDSDVSQINQAAGCHDVVVAEETFALIQDALRYADQTQGAFDPTLQTFGYRKVQIDSARRAVFLPETGMTLDFGGIGKGFALDRALAKVLSVETPESVSADFGGQLLFWHRDARFGPETVIVENPETGGLGDSFKIHSNCSISTSSNAERPGHLRNPLTGEGMPRRGSVTWIAPTGIEAEALSTAYFVQGQFGIYGLS